MALNSSPLGLFMYRLRAPDTRRQYPARLKRFFDFSQIEGSDLEQQCQNFVKGAALDQKYAFELLVNFLEYMNAKARKKEIVFGTVNNYYKAVKSFLEMNSIILNWKLISSGLLPSRKSANDRAPTAEEMRKLVEYPDPRIKSIVYMMASGGFRVGAWDWLRWKHVIPQFDRNTEVVAAKVIIYEGEPDEYFTYITPEAYNALNGWMDYRKSYGEVIGPESWLMRNLWQTTNTKWGARWGLAIAPRQLKSEAIKRLLERALRDTGLRKPLDAGVKRHEWKASHGFRKFYDTQAKAADMLNNYVEQTMGHSLGVAQNYDRPTDDQILQQYLKAVPVLTINDDSLIINRRLHELQESTRDDSNVVTERFAEKDDEIALLNRRINELRSDMNAHYEFLGIAKKIIARNKDGFMDNGGSILDSRRRVTLMYGDDNNKIKTVKIPIDDFEILDGDARANADSF
jgi:hypothetical protein